MPVSQAWRSGSTMYRRLILSRKMPQYLPEPGEVVVGPSKPTRVKTANCFGIYYGEGKGLDAANIFARVIDADMKKLEELGDSIWKDGPQELRIEALKE